MRKAIVLLLVSAIIVLLLVVGLRRSVPGDTESNRSTTTMSAASTEHHHTAAVNTKRVSVSDTVNVVDNSYRSDGATAHVAVTPPIHGAPYAELVRYTADELYHEWERVLQSGHEERLTVIENALVKKLRNSSDDGEDVGVYTSILNAFESGSLTVEQMIRMARLLGRAGTPESVDLILTVTTLPITDDVRMALNGQLLGLGLNQWSTTASEEISEQISRRLRAPVTDADLPHTTAKAAYNALADLGYPGGVQSLLDAAAHHGTADADSWRLHAAKDALARVTNPMAIPALRDALMDYETDHVTALLAGSALSSIPDTESVSTLFAFAQTRDAEFTEWITHWFERIEKPHLRAFIEQRLQDDGDDFQSIDIRDAIAVSIAAGDEPPK